VHELMGMDAKTGSWQPCCCEHILRVALNAIDGVRLHPRARGCGLAPIFRPMSDTLVTLRSPSVTCARDSVPFPEQHNKYRSCTRAFRGIAVALPERSAAARLLWHEMKPE